MGRGGERCQFCSLHRVYLSLDYTCQGTGRGPRPNSKAPPLIPSLWPREGGYRPAVCPVHLPFPPPSPPPCLPTPTTSSLRHRDSVQGLEGPGWTPGPRADQRPWQALVILSWTFFFFFWYPLSPDFFVFLALAENGMISCQSTDSPCPLAAAAFRTTRCNLMFPSPPKNRGNSNAKGVRQAAGEVSRAQCSWRTALPPHPHPDPPCPNGGKPAFPPLEPPLPLG